MFWMIYFVMVFVSYFMIRAGLKYEKKKNHHVDYDGGDFMVILLFLVIPVINMGFALWCYLYCMSSYNKKFDKSKKNPVYAFMMIKDSKDE